MTKKMERGKYGLHVIVKFKNIEATSRLDRREEKEVPGDTGMRSV